MKKLAIAFGITLYAASANAGPVVDFYSCELNPGKTYADAVAVMNTFAEMQERAGLTEHYQAHIGFQQVPIVSRSVNWIAFSPSAESRGLAYDWFTGTTDGSAFADLYQSTWTCETSSETYVIASSPQQP